MSGGAERVRVRRIEGAPVVAVRVALVGGARVEPAPSTALLTGRMLAEGSIRRDYRQLALDAESRGASLVSYGGYESIGVAVDALAADWRRALDLAAELLFEPAFPEERLSLLTRQAAAELESYADQAEVATAQAFSADLYGAHARGRPLQGDERSLAALAPADCRRCHAEALRAGGVVVIAGAIDEGEVGAAAEALFGGLAPLGTVPEPRVAPPPPAARRREVTTRARDQAHLFVGQLTVRRGDPDHAALELAGVALGSGAGLTGRIPFRVREREGLAYAAAADTVAGAGLDPGRLFAYAGTSPETVGRAEAAAIEEISTYVAEGPTAGELEEARSYLLGREPFRRETARQWADLAAQAALLGLPLEDAAARRAAIERPTRDDVAAALGRHVDASLLTVTVGLPPA